MSTEKIDIVCNLDYDVIIIGAGISGIGFAYRLKQSNPDLTYAILETRHEIGGTWSYFCYPGIRSDSDFYTFSFPWKPYIKDQAIAKGLLIKDYLNEAITEQGIDGHIEFNHRVNSLNWSSTTNTWTLDITATTAIGQTQRTLSSRFVMLGSGYYDYNIPLKADIPGIENFEGKVIHPQFWPKDYDYTNKNVVIVGSGATAITLVPTMAEKAAHVTMLQRSPTWIVARGNNNLFDHILIALLPKTFAFYVLRLKWALVGWFLVWFCLRFPVSARKLLLADTKKQLPDGMDLTPDFTPEYNPWAQRMCLSPDGDFYQAIRSGKANIVTDHIGTVTATSINLKSGDQLNPDVIVTATGLRTVIGGKIAITVDGERLHIPDLYSWKCSMLEGLPNLFYTFGYLDASWTMGADATARLAARMIRQLRRDGKKVLIPTRTEREKATMKEVPYLRMKSTYLKSGLCYMPKAGDARQWMPRSDFITDAMDSWWGDIRSSIEWR